MSRPANLYDKNPEFFQMFARIGEIWIFFEPNILHKRLKKGQTTAHVNGRIVVTILGWEINKHISKARKSKI